MKRKSSLLILLIILASVPSIYAQIPTDSLAGYWPFTGSAVDSSGYNHNGTVIGATLAKDRFGNIDRAYMFNGAGEYINVEDSSSLDNTNGLTISFWINACNLGADAPKEYIPLISKWYSYTSPDSCSYLIYMDGDTVNFRVHDGVNEDLVSTTIPFQRIEWVHFIFIFDNGNINIYMNNQLVQSKTVSINSINNSAIDLKIGNWFQDYDSAYSTFDGLIDDVAIYRKALSIGEVNDLYSVSFCFETVTTYDTVSIQVFDTTFITIYDSIAVTDTLIIDVILTGINPPNNLNTFKIYPNPVSDHVIINTGDFNQMTSYSLEIVNSLGQTVFQSLVNQQEFQINVNTFGNNGTYLVNILDHLGNLKESRKLILQ